ncbi:outer membrane beta-barrel protein [Mucilaginibacter sp. Mucisp86]|uniref:outer membrane beta-barrel protein n=1 Tax=Mucilaginibacter sp. Mucisp86 TaxID=3243060 RepID=UPI0039B590F5
MKSAFRYFLLFSGMVYANLCYAQGYMSGRVTDDKGLPLPGVVVRLQKLPDTALLQAAATDTSGRFVFKKVAPGNYRLQTLMIGYQTTVRMGLVMGSADTLEVGKIALTPVATQLKEVAIRSTMPLIDRQLDKTVVNIEQNITNTGTNALELLKKLPGVTVGPEGQISLNGKSGVNVILDGKTTFLSADDLASLLTNTPSSDISRIELMTNPSAKYDAQGTGGIINIIRKKSHQNGLNGSFTTSAGQGFYGRNSSSLALAYQTGKYNVYLNNSYGYNKGYNLNQVTTDVLNRNALASEQMSVNTGVTMNRTCNTSGGLDLFLSKQTTLSLTGSVSARRYYNLLTSGMTLADSNRNKTGSENFSALNRDQPLNYTAGLQLLHKLDTAGRQWSADVNYASYRYQPGQYNTALNFDAAGNYASQDNVFIDESRTLRVFGARVDYVRPLSGGGKLEAGLKSSYVKTVNNSIYYNQLNGQNIPDPSQSDDDINTENINAAYINFNRQYQKLTVQAGLRAEQTVLKGQQVLTGESVDQNYIGLFPTLFLSDQLNDQQTLNFQFGRRTDRPDYHEYVPFRRALSPTIYFQGNPNLLPAFNWHTEFTWSWKHTLAITAAYDINRNYMRTLYYLDANQTTITRMPTNIQGAHSWNLDVSYTKELTKWLTTNTSATIYQNYFNGSTFQGYSLNDPGMATIDLVSNNTFRCNEGLSLEADFEYESKRQFVGSIFGAYATVDAAVRQKLFHGKGSLTLNAINALNTDRRRSTDRYLNLYQHGSSHIYSQALIATLTYRFGIGKTRKTQQRSGSEEEQKRAGN